MNNIKDNKTFLNRWRKIRFVLFFNALAIYVFVIPLAIDLATEVQMAKVYRESFVWLYVCIVIIQVLVLEIALFFRDDPEKEEGYFDNLRPEKAECNMLQTYYTEIHTRSRTYGTHLWQVPFAYLAAISLSISIIFKADTSKENILSELLPTVFFAAGFSGIFLLYFMEYLSSRNQRTAMIMKKLERYLELPESTLMVSIEETFVQESNGFLQDIVKKKPIILLMPLFWLCLFLIASLFVLSIYYLMK